MYAWFIADIPFISGNLFHQRDVIELNEYVQRENCENKHALDVWRKKRTKLLIDKLTLISGSLGMSMKITRSFPISINIYYSFSLLFFLFYSIHFTNSQQRPIKNKSSNNESCINRNSILFWEKLCLLHKASMECNILQVINVIFEHFSVVTYIIWSDPIVNVEIQNIFEILHFKCKTFNGFKVEHIQFSFRFLSN